MGIKEIKPGEGSPENISQKKPVRDLGSVGLDELVRTVALKIEEKVQQVDAKDGSAAEVKKQDTPELKKQYFHKVGVEKNHDTTAARALRGNTAGGAADAKNLKLVVLPKLERQADPGQVQTFGDKANMGAPFQMELGDLLGKTLERVQKKPDAAARRMDRLSEKMKAREQRFGKKVPPSDQDPNEFCEEEYNRQKRKKAVMKMFQHMNKALGTKMDTTGAPPELLEDDGKKKSAKPSTDDDF